MIVGRKTPSVVSTAGMGGLEIIIDDRHLRAFLSTSFPSLVNSEANRAYNSAVSTFAKQFTREKLTGEAAPYTVRRRRNVGKGRKGAPAIPKLARDAGFRAKLVNRHKLAGKASMFYTRNPAVTLKETGGTIRAKAGKYLYFRTPAGRGGGPRSIGARLKEFTFRPTLGLRADWRAFQPRATQILAAAKTRIVARAQASLDRKPGRFFEKVIVDAAG